MVEDLPGMLDALKSIPKNQQYGHSPIVSQDCSVGKVTSLVIDGENFRGQVMYFLFSSSVNMSLLSGGCLFFVLSISECHRCSVASL